MPLSGHAASIEAEFAERAHEALHVPLAVGLLPVAGEEPFGALE